MYISFSGDEKEFVDSINKILSVDINLNIENISEYLTLLNEVLFNVEKLIENEDIEELLIENYKLKTEKTVYEICREIFRDFDMLLETNKEYS